MIRTAREAIVAVSRRGFVRNVGFLGAGAAAVQGSLLLATPFILSLYGASAFGLFATILATTSVIGGLVALHIDTAIPVIEARFRALRLVSAVVGIIGVVTVGEYAALALLSACSGGLRNWMGDIGLLYFIWVPAIAFTQTIVVACRAWMIRSQTFRLAVLCNFFRVAVFISLALILGRILARDAHVIVNGLLIAQVAGDLCAIALFLWRSRRRERRLMLPWPIRRPLAELRANRGLIGTTSVTGLLAIINTNIPIWTISYVFGLSPTGWFSAAQRIVAAPVQFAIDTVGVAFKQRAREKRSRGEPIGGDVLKVLAALLIMLTPVFALLAWLSRSDHLAFLGRDWAGAGPTLAAMILISFGSIFHSAMEGLPLVFRLQRLLIGYHAARSVAVCVLAVVALSGLAGYATWIYLYALCEMLLYAGNALSIYMAVRRVEAAKRQGSG